MAKTNPYHQPYYALVASLPDLVLPLPVYKNVPLDDDALQSRLTMMTEEDAAEVVKVVNLLCRQSLDSDDKPLRKEFETVLSELTHKGLKSLVQQNMRWRTVESALLLSCAGKTLPPLKEDEKDDWGYDDALMAHIRSNWKHPNFSLSMTYPNIMPLRKIIMDNHFSRVNDWCEHARWAYYVGQDENYEFSVENVALFMIRRMMVKHRLERNTAKTVEMMEDAVTTMIDKTELAL